jgi:YVTN family beta-propeller protein
MPRRTLSLLMLGLLAGCTAQSKPPQPAYLVYASNEVSGDLSVIDPIARRVIQTIPVGKRPRGLALSPDRRLLYIALTGSPMGGPGIDESKLPPPDKAADGVAVLDRVSGKVVKVLRGVSDPEQIAVSPDGTRLFVASEDTGRMIVLNAVTGAVVARVDVGGEPEGVAVSPDGSLALATSEEDDKLSFLDTRSMRLVAQVDVGERPRNAVFTPKGDLAIVPGELDASVTLVDVRKRQQVARLILLKDQRPAGVAMAPDGKNAFVTTGRGGKLVKIDLTARHPVGALAVGTRPWGVSLSPDGGYAFTANGPSDDVTMVDVASMTEVARFKAGAKPWGVLAAARP